MDKKRGLTLASCCGAHVLQDGLSASIYVLLPVLAQAFDLSYSQVGVIRAANNTAMGLFEIPSGMLSERLGQRSLLVFGLVCAGTGYLSLSAANGFGIVLFSLFLAGFGAAFQHALSSSLISRTFEASGRRAALGIYNSSGDIGKLAFTGGFSLAVGMGVAWKGAATGFGLLALIAAAVLYFILHHLDAGSRPASALSKARAAGKTGWGIRNATGFTALALIVFLDIAVQSGFLTFVPFLMMEKQVPAGLAAFAVVLTLGGGILGKFSCGFLAERLGVIRSLVAVECLTAIGIVAVLAAPTLIAFLLLPVIGMVLQGSSSITYGSVGDLVQADRHPRGFAAIYSVASSSAIVAPVGLGLIADGYGLTPTMLAMVCIVLLPLPLCALLRPALAGEHA